MNRNEFEAKRNSDMAEQQAATLRRAAELGSAGLPVHLAKIVRNHFEQWLPNVGPGGLVPLQVLTEAEFVIKNRS